MLNRISTYLYICAVILFVSSCGAEVQFRKAEQSYVLGEYSNAASLYKKAYSGTPSKEKEMRSKLAFMMGECYRRTNYTARAITAYQNAIRYNAADSLSYKFLADMQLKNGDFKNAEKNYIIYLEYSPNDSLAINGLKSCELSQKWKKSVTRYIIKKDPVLNSRFSDYSPAFGNSDYSKLFFTSTRNEALGEDINGITGMKSCDIFVSEKDKNGKWQKPTIIEGGPNSGFEDGSCAFSNDFNTMYFTYCPMDAQYPRPAQIMKSIRSEAEWKTAEPYSTQDDTIFSYAHPALSPDGKWIYFVSDLSGGYGGYDIWRVPIGERLIGAENLGPDINTPGNEMFPTFRKNGELYFSSDGHPGMGGLDIFKAVLSDDFKWIITNMQSPINSAADDFGMTFEGDFTRGFFSSNRNDGRGRDHIYSFVLPETIHTITGWVYEKDGYELKDAQVYIVGEDGTNIKVGVREDGSFTQRVNPGTDYLLLGSTKGYMNFKQEITTDSTVEDREYVLQFPLSSITKPVLIDNIFFDFNKASLREESTAALTDLVNLLKDNPNVTIEIGAHCDYKGNDQYNIDLSQQRSESVVQHLINNGIDPERLQAKGYGENKPKTISRKMAEKYSFLKEGDILTENFIKDLPEDQQEICNQLNRRTEFRVLRTTYGMFGR